MAEDQKEKTEGVEKLEIAEGFVSSLMNTAYGTYERDGFLHPVCFLGAACNPSDGELFTETEIVLVSPPQVGVSVYDEAGREAFAERVREVVIKAKCVMVVMVAEMLDAAGGEYVQIALEHQRLGNTVKVWRGSVTREAEGKAVLGPFGEPQTLDKAAGKFTGFLELPS